MSLLQNRLVHMGVGWEFYYICVHDYHEVEQKVSCCWPFQQPNLILNLNCELNNSSSLVYPCLLSCRLVCGMYVEFHKEILTTSSGPINDLVNHELKLVQPCLVCL